MSLNLYDLSSLYQEALECAIDKETGEIKDDEMFELLDEINEQYEEKIINCGLYYKSLIAEANAIKEEERKLYNRRKSIENSAQRFKDYIELNLKTGEKIKDPRIIINWRKSTKLHVDAEVKDNPAILPDLFYRTKTEIEKSKISNHLKSGRELKGCKLIECQNLQIK